MCFAGTSPSCGSQKAKGRTDGSSILIWSTFSFSNVRSYAIKKIVWENLVNIRRFIHLRHSVFLATIQKLQLADLVHQHSPYIGVTVLHRYTATVLQCYIVIVLQRYSPDLLKDTIYTK